jgi:hypothetical protein
MKINVSGGSVLGRCWVGGESIDMDIHSQMILFNADNRYLKTRMTTVGMRALQLSVFKGVCMTWL